jgi:hypothetical protein
MATLRSRIEALEERASLSTRMHFVWEAPGVDVKAEIAARIAEGTAQATDKFYSFSWRPPGRETDMHPDSLRPSSPSTGPRPSPHPANDQ